MAGPGNENTYFCVNPKKQVLMTSFIDKLLPLNNAIAKGKQYH
jgi:hypothetical protein